jgi:hypothetical protein
LLIDCRLAADRQRAAPRKRLSRPSTPAWPPRASSTRSPRYIRVGFRTFVTDIPLAEEELTHQKTVFQLALESAGEG